ncbi:glycosyltransferase family 4 protein [Dysgonomonadaceae bacterium zrk40]|nr:glycosyltransferase family 4 protein [Dysgonomonadaceae bacterium zrk40]
MIKVLYVISNLNVQGPVRQLLYLCKYINKEQIRPYIVTISQTSFDKSLHSKFLELGVVIFDLKLKEVKSILFAHTEIQKIITDNNIDIIQSFGFRSDIISSKLINVFKITTVRNTLLFNWKMVWGSFLGTIFGNIHRYYIQKFDSIIACSTAVHNYLRKLLIKSYTIVNSLDTEIISERLNFELITEKRKLLNLPIIATINITVSSQLKGKNIEFLIKSFQANSLLNSYLIIAGFVDPVIVQECSKYDNIIIVGKINNLKDYLQASNFFISASLHEGMPNAVLESMAVGTPVLLSNIPSHKEIFEKANCEIGKIFDNNNYNDFFLSYKELLNSDYNKLSSNCIDTIKNHFNARKMAIEYENYYFAILKI